MLSSMVAIHNENMTPPSISSDIREENHNLVPDSIYQNYEKMYPDLFKILQDERTKLLSYTLSVGEVIEELQKVPKDDPFLVYVFTHNLFRRTDVEVAKKSFRRNHMNGITCLMVDL